MLIKLLAALAALWVINWMVRRWRRASPAQRRKLAWRWGLGGALVILTVAAVSGRAHWLGAIAAGAAALARVAFVYGFRFLPFLMRRVDRVPLTTPFLRVEVDINGRRYRGTVLAGPHEGKAVESLSREELAELAEYYRERDRRSYYIISLIARGGGFDGTAGSGQADAGREAGLEPSRAEALAILGLDNDPTEQEVVQAHRRLIQKLHPDRGGSDFLAAQVNRAKDVLLANRQRDR